MLSLLLLLLLLAAPVAAQSGPTVRFAGAVNQDGCPFCCASAPAAWGGATYQPLTGAAVGQDFLAMLIGDCTGNWVQGAVFAASADAPAGVRLRVSRRTAEGTLRVPIAVDAAAPFLAVDLTLQLGPGLRATGLRKLRGAAEAMATTGAARAN